eukprot:GHRR01021554.1.p1 GENE.GHRR01021554.1~~GHRR01021554.1.p1  ORF type:complete len:180 (+),score=55.48 GHRR01021554.1:123-662(+)
MVLAMGTGSEVLEGSAEASTSVVKNIYVTDGQHRVLCISQQLPAGMKRSDGRWRLDQFELLTELYRGKTSALHEAIDARSGLRVAIKQYRKSRLSALNRAQVGREVQIHVRLHHPNIASLYAAFEDPERVYLVQEFAPGGDLFEALKRAPDMLYTETEAAARFIAPLLDALIYLHERVR